MQMNSSEYRTSAEMKAPSSPTSALRRLSSELLSNARHKRVC